MTNTGGISQISHFLSVTASESVTISLLSMSLLLRPSRREVDECHVSSCVGPTQRLHLFGSGVNRSIEVRTIFGWDVITPRVFVRPSEAETLPRTDPSSYVLSGIGFCVCSARSITFPPEEPGERTRPNSFVRPSIGPPLTSRVYDAS